MDADRNVPWFSRVMDKLEKIINFICVIFLLLQVVTINGMVIGRYFFKFVPLGTEEFALFCMVWFSLFSIMLSIRNDAFIKMELVDLFLPKNKVLYFKFFATVVCFVFSICMIVYGIDLVMLTGTARMASIPISKGWLYLSLPASGVGLALSNLVLMVEIVWRGKNVV